MWSSVCFLGTELTESLVVSDALLQLRSVCARLLAGCCSALPSAGVFKGAREPCPRGRRDEAAACGQPAGGLGVEPWRARQGKFPGGRGPSPTSAPARHGRQATRSRQVR